VGEWLAGQLKSSVLTHRRLKHLATIAECTEDIISRLALGRSIGMGKVNLSFAPEKLDASIEAPNLDVTKGKSLRCKTLLKSEDDALLFLSAMQWKQESSLSDPVAWKEALGAHWERGVQQLIVDANGEGGEHAWLRVLSTVVEASAPSMAA